MQINTSVVSALLWLKGLDTGTLSKLVHVPHRDLIKWLTDDSAEELIAYDTQLEILALLGVRGASPREDVVHYWALHEGFLSRRDSVYEPLGTILKAFGPAQASFVTREADPMLSLKAKAHFALKFTNFMAILEVTAHPLRSISFDPASMSDLSWAPGAQGILLEEEEYARLEPGSLKVRGLHTSLTYTAEMGQWEKLRESAIENGISAEQVATLLLGAAPQGPALSVSPQHSKLSGAGLSIRTAGPAPGGASTAQKPAASAGTAVPQHKGVNPRDLFSKPVSNIDS